MPRVLGMALLGPLLLVAEPLARAEKWPAPRPLATASLDGDTFLGAELIRGRITNQGEATYAQLHIDVNLGGSRWNLELQIPMVSFDWPRTNEADTGFGSVSIGFRWARELGPGRLGVSLGGVVPAIYIPFDAAGIGNWRTPMTPANQFPGPFLELTYGYRRGPFLAQVGAGAAYMFFTGAARIAGTLAVTAGWGFSLVLEGGATVDGNFALAGVHFDRRPITASVSLFLPMRSDTRSGDDTLEQGPVAQLGVRF